METELKKESVLVITTLITKLQDILKRGSNIEIVWELERLHKDEILKKSADLIRKQL